MHSCVSNSTWAKGLPQQDRQGWSSGLQTPPQHSIPLPDKTLKGGLQPQQRCEKAWASRSRREDGWAGERFSTWPTWVPPDSLLCPLVALPFSLVRSQDCHSNAYLAHCTMTHRSKCIAFTFTSGTQRAPGAVLVLPWQQKRTIRASLGNVKICGSVIHRYGWAVAEGLMGSQPAPGLRQCHH